MSPLSANPSPSDLSSMSSSIDSSDTRSLSSSAGRIDKECQRCISYLARALEQPGRPQSLLRAMGVVHPNNSSSSDDSDRMFTPTPDGRGVVLQLNSNHAIKPPTPTLLQDSASQPPHQTLKRRLTSAASRMVGLGSSGNGGVLTTSPSTSSLTSHPTIAMPKETSITIECVKCGTDTRAEAGARAYVRGPTPLSIILCSNRLSSQREVDEVLIHELIHVYDVFLRQMDLRQCHPLAYSEVRAARDAECQYSLTNFTKMLCVKEKAAVATKNMFPEHGKKCVCDVFEKAMNDVAPLGLDFNTVIKQKQQQQRSNLTEKKMTNASNTATTGGGSDVGGTSGMTFMPREARPSER